MKTKKPQATDLTEALEIVTAAIQRMRETIAKASGDVDKVARIIERMKKSRKERHD